MFEKILDFIYPRKCIFCDRILDVKSIEKQYFACNNCKIKLKYTSKGLSLRKEANKYYDYSYFSYAYEGFIRKIIINFKFYNKKYLCDFLSYQTAKDIQNFNVGKIDYIYYIPISLKRYFERGYNQSYLLAKCISKQVGIPIKRFGLIKIKNNQMQSSLSKSERLNNIKGVYKALFLDDIKGKTILLIDDIFTTGATINEASKVLKKAGAKKIIAITIAKA